MATEQTDIEQRVTRASTAIYLTIAIGAGVIFIAAALAGGFPVVAVYGGAVWTFFLTLIIAMPWATTRVRARLNAKG